MLTYVIPGACTTAGTNRHCYLQSRAAKGLLTPAQASLPWLAAIVIGNITAGTPACRPPAGYR